MRKINLFILSVVSLFFISLIFVTNVYAAGNGNTTLNLKVVSPSGTTLNEDFKGYFGGNATVNTDGLAGLGQEVAFIIHNGKMINDVAPSFLISGSTNVVVIIKDTGTMVKAYVDSNGHFLDAKFDGDLSELSLDLSKPGYVFDSWVPDINNDEVKENYLYVAKYVSTGTIVPVDISIINGTSSNPNPLYNEVVELTPTANFSYWADADGQVISTNPNYKFTAIKQNGNENITLEAIYDENFISAPSVYLNNVTGIREGYQSFLGYINNINGYKLIEYGLLVSNQAEVLDHDNAEVVIPSGSLSPNNEFLRSFEQGIYGSFRAYAVFLYEGNEVIVYSGNNFSREISVELFDQFSIGSYSDGTYQGAHDISWDYISSRNNGGYPIEDAGIMLRSDENNSSLSVLFPNGLYSFSFDYRKAFTSNSVRNYLVDIIYNGIIETYNLEEFGNAIGEDKTVYSFNKNINVSSEVVIKVYAKSDGQATFGNFQWQDIRNLNRLYKVKLLNDINELEIIYYQHGDRFNPLEPIKEGYKFDGWFMDSEFQNPLENEMIVKSHMSLYPKFKKIEMFEVAFDVGEGDQAPLEYINKTVEQNTKISDPGIPIAPNGKVFMGWYENLENDTIFDFDSLITYDLFLYAKYIDENYDFSGIYSTTFSEVSNGTVINTSVFKDNPNIFEIISGKNNATSAPKYYLSGDAARFYGKDDGNGSSLLIKVDDKYKIDYIELVFPKTGQVAGNILVNSGNITILDVIANDNDFKAELIDNKFKYDFILEGINQNEFKIQNTAVNQFRLSGIIIKVSLK